MAVGGQMGSGSMGRTTGAAFSPVHEATPNPKAPLATHGLSPPPRVELLYIEFVKIQFNSVAESGVAPLATHGVSPGRQREVHPTPYTPNPKP